MNTELLRRRMDRFFKRITSEELAGIFMSFGYEFISVKTEPSSLKDSIPISTIYENLWGGHVPFEPETNKKGLDICQGLFYL